MIYGKALINFTFPQKLFPALAILDTDENILSQIRFIKQIIHHWQLKTKFY